ncbi:MAG: metallophosphoesterase [Clostridia bacterium]|nr:metallophosphoesterase [Clostridia bacterium]
MISLLRQFVAMLTSLLMLFGIYHAPAKDDPVVALEPAAVQTQIALFADTQIIANTKRQFACKAAFEDVDNNAAVIDGLVVAGDISESGDDITNEIIINMIKETTVGRKIIASGNHDVRLNYKHTMARFINDVNNLGCADYTVEKPYYYTTVNGYYFIVLGTEKQVLEKAYISDTQLQFLDEMLAEATKDGKPAFVVVHQPLANTNGLPGIWKTGDLGNQSEAVGDIMNKYDNVFYLCGHTHAGFYEYTYDTYKGKTPCINIPTVGKVSSRGYKDNGLGFMMEIYEDKVVFRSRDFADGYYLGGEHPDFDRTYPLV